MRNEPNDFDVVVATIAMYHWNSLHIKEHISVYDVLANSFNCGWHKLKLAIDRATEIGLIGYYQTRKYPWVTPAGLRYFKEQCEQNNFKALSKRAV